MRSNNRLHSTVAILALCSSSMVVDAANQKLGINMGYGTQTADLAEDRDIFNDNLSGGVFYRYMPSYFWGVETSFSQGSSGFFSSMVRGALGSDVQGLSYNSLDSALIGELPVSERNSVYVKAGFALNNIDYELNNGSRNTINELGLIGGIGWLYQFDMGLSMGIEYKINQAKNFGVNLFNLGLSYQF